MFDLQRAADIGRNEPVALAAVVRVTLALGVAFGLSLSGEQVAALVLFVEVWAAFVVRRAVSPTAGASAWEGPLTADE